MPPRLERRQQTGNFHLITFSCHDRLPLLLTPAAKQTFLEVLEQTRKHHTLKIAGYVIMPEHVHLLTDEPQDRPLGTVLQVLKQTTSRYLKPPGQPHFWLPRYHDFNVHTHTKYTKSSATSTAIPSPAASSPAPKTTRGAASATTPATSPAPSKSNPNSPPTTAPDNTRGTQP